MTIGFSEKTNSWTSSYSYSPMHISSNSEHMVTFSKNLLNANTTGQSLCWAHKGTTQTKNTFYKKFSPSVFSVVFNQNQSMEKVFNAVTIESNQNQFSASLSTNIDQPYPDASSTKIQTSYIPKFYDREENLYSDCRKSSINSKQNVSLFGVNPTYSINAIQNQSGSAELKIGFDQITSSIPSGGKLFVYTVIGGVPTYFSFVNENLVESNNSLEYSNNHKGFTLVTNSNEVRLLFENVNTASLFNPTFLSTIFDNALYIGCINDPSIYGDDMRGKYMVATFSSDDSKPFEISGLNCEFSHSKLDTE